MFGVTEFEIFAVAVILFLWAIHERLTSIKKLLEQQRADRSKKEHSLSSLAKNLARGYFGTDQRERSITLCSPQCCL